MAFQDWFLYFLQVDDGTGKYHTYGDVCRVSRRVRDGLIDVGVGVGDAVLLLSPNHIDIPLVMLSVILRPAICVPGSPTLTPGKPSLEYETSLMILLFPIFLYCMPIPELTRMQPYDLQFFLCVVIKACNHLAVICSSHTRN